MKIIIIYMLILDLPVLVILVLYRMLTIYFFFSCCAIDYFTALPATFLPLEILVALMGDVFTVWV